MSEPAVDGVALTARLAVIAQARAALHGDRAMLDALTPTDLVPEPVAAQHAALVVLVRDLLKAFAQPDHILDQLTLNAITNALTPPDDRQ